MAKKLTIDPDLKDAAVKYVEASMRNATKAGYGFVFDREDDAYQCAVPVQRLRNQLIRGTYRPRGFSVGAVLAGVLHKHGALSLQEFCKSFTQPKRVM